MRSGRFRGSGLRRLARRDDGALVLTYVIIVPVFMLVIMVIIQGALWYLAREAALAARAASMRAEALAAERARAGARSTTMVIPIALLGAGFLLLLIFPIVYRTFGPG